MCLFLRKGDLFGFCKGNLAVILQIPMLPVKSCLGVTLGVKTTQNFHLGGVFPEEGKSCLWYVLKTSGHTCVQH